VKDKFNEKGYFENKNILKFNNSCLRKIGSSWNTPDEITHEQRDIMLAEYDSLLQIITEEYDQDLCLIKDPRIAILWPLYRSVLDDLKIDHPMILLKRNQAASVLSMGRMARLSAERASSVYDGYYRLIDKMKTDCSTHEVHFERLLADPKVAMKEMCSFLEIPYGKKQHALVNEFIDEKLLRYK